MKQHSGSQDEVVFSVTQATVESLLRPKISPFHAAEVHLWEFPLAVDDSVFSALEQHLSGEERTRAARFHVLADRRRFAVGRGVVRSILAAYTAISARELSFLYSQHGKPRLEKSELDIRFNVSHSGDRGLLGLTVGQEVGVDIEAIKENIECDKLAERFFSADERESLRGLVGEKQKQAFFRCWTCKESFLKAQGVGLSRSLGSFDIDLVAKKVRLAGTRPDASEASRWSLFEIEAAPGYAAAVCVEGSIGAIRIVRCN